MSASTSEMLLEELQHRTKNTLSIIDALLTLQAQASENEEVRQALFEAATRVRIQAEAHRHLTMKEVGRADAQEYLQQICKLLEATLAGVRPTVIECRAQQTMIDAQGRCRFALILALLALILIFIGLQWSADRTAALLFLPYAVWVAFASVLNAAVLKLNPAALRG